MWEQRDQQAPFQSFGDVVSASSRMHHREYELNVLYYTEFAGLLQIVESFLLDRLSHDFVCHLITISRARILN